MIKPIFAILKTITVPFWGPIWLQFFLIKKCWRFVVVLLAASIISGCASNSAKLDLSPCAGCDFMPINSVSSVTSQQG